MVEGEGESTHSELTVRDRLVLRGSSNLDESSTISQGTQSYTTTVDDERVDEQIVAAGGERGIEREIRERRRRKRTTVSS